MRTKRMNRHLCFWNFASLLHSWPNRPGRHRRARQATGGLHHLSRLAPNFPYRRGLLALSLVLPATALAGPPAGEQVTAGIATVTRPNAVTTLITQQTSKAVIDWQNFSIAQPEMVRFQQPGTDSIALNRVLGHDPSRIYGSLSANGQVFLVNPNGVLFAPGSQVSVHGLLATTHDIDNDDFLAGRYTFTSQANPHSTAEVVNQGNLAANAGGYIVLAGDYTANTGVIQARLGQVALASGNRFTIDLDGDRLIGLAVDEASLIQRAGAENLGTLAADGGQVVMTARVAGELAGTVVNNKGLIQARSIGEQNGEIVLSGGTHGIVANSGSLDASGRSAGESGGSVKMLGEKVGLLDKGVVDVSGANGGGTALIGGDYQGINPGIENAQATYLGQDTVIRADATGNGNGGRVIVWADKMTRAYGAISARGGATGGDGGFVEVSGKGYLDFLGAVDTRAPLGRAGILLLDPADITIQAASPDIDGILSGATNDITTATDLDVAATDYTGANSVITSGALGGLLNTTDVTLAATNDITVNDAVSWTNAFSLTLDAGNNIAVNANVTSPMAAPTGNITLTAGNLISIGANLALTNSTNPSGVITMTAGAGGIDQYGGTITAASLKMTSTGIVDLPFLNQVTTIAANVTGAGSAFGYESANGFSIGNVGGMLGVTTNNGNITTRGYGSTPIQIAENVTAGTGSALIGQAAVGPGGDIDVAATKTVSGGNVQLYASDAGGLLTINGTTSGTSSVLLSTPGALTVTSTGVVSGPSLTLTADNMTLQAGTSVNAGAGTAWLKPNTAGLLIDLGGADSAGTLGLDTNELNTATTTGVLRVGALTAGNLNVSAAIAPANVSTLSLESGGTITQAGAGTINETNLAIKAYGDVTLDTAPNLITNLAASIGDGSNQNKNFRFKNSPALNIGASIDTISGITIARDANNFNSASPNGVIALISTLGLTQSAGATLSGKAVYAEGSRVVLTQANPTGVIAGKATGSSAGDLFNYTSSSGISVTTVNGFAGIQSASTEPSGVLLTADSNGISQDATAPINASGTGLMLSTTGTVNLGGSTANDVGALATAVATGQLLFNDINTLTLGISGSGVATSAGNPVSITAGGLLKVQDPINAAGSGVLSLEAPSIQLGIGAGTTITGGLIKLRANGAAASGTISSAGTSSTVTSASGLELEADNMDFSVAAPTFTATNEIGYRTFTDNRAITYGAAGCHGGGVNCLTITGATNTAPDLVIGNDAVADSNTAGNISIDGALTHAGGRVALLTGGGIDQTAAISTTSLGFVAGTVTNAAGVILTQTNAISNVAGETQGGAVQLTNSPALSIVQMSGGDPLYSDVRTVTGIATNGGDTTISNTGTITLTALISAGAGAVTLTSGNGAIVDGNGSGVNNVVAGSLDISANTGIDLDAQVPTSSVIATSTSGAVTVRSYPPAAPEPPPPPPPTIDACTTNPALSGCSSVLPSLDTCTSNPTAPGCTAVLPTLDTCTVTPTAAGCSAVLPSIDTCTATPSAPGCTVVLPPLTDCTTNSTLPGCTAVLPSLDTCTTDPAAPGCTAVLPPLTDCTTNPALPGCTAVLPSLDTCTTDPAAPGCTAVLPPLTDCTTNPALPGCTAVLPSLSTCTATPTAPGCTAVLPPLTDCTTNPALPGCTAVLPSLDTCAATPTAPGCTAVLPTIGTCTTTPAAPGCTVVLPPLTDCTTNPALPGCTAVLPAIDTCTATPTAPGCTAVLPPLATCVTDPALPGCTAVLPLPPSVETPVEIVETIQAVVIVDLVVPAQTAQIGIGTPPPAPAPEQPASSSQANGAPGNGNNEENRERRAEDVPLTTTSQELPLARQPIFDLGGGGIAGQNMVCR